MGRVIVGVDGSPPARAALEWAAEHAAARAMDLHVMMVYRPSSGDNPHSVVDGGETGVRHMEDQARLADDWRTEHDRFVRLEAEAQVRSMVDDLPGPLPERVVADTAAARRPASALIEAAENADLLVVGSRGRGGFAGLVLGSVSQQLAHHTPCPVVIVPSD